MKKKADFKLSDSKYRKLKMFTMHGLHVNELAGSQAISDCPFCGKEGHFFINYSKALWDCKTCGAKGNAISFLELINKKHQKGISENEIKILAKDRNLFKSAFKNWGIGYSRGMYSFPVYNSLNKLQDIRLYRIGGRVISTSQAKTGLFGLQKMLKNKKDPIFVCEGEWDAIAMQWLLNKVSKPGVAISAPGANTFKVEWSDLFKGRDVIVCYDNDTAGEQGQQLLLERLNGIISSLVFICWPDSKSEGFDIRDFIIKEAIKKKKPRRAYKILQEYLQDRPKNCEDRTTVVTKKTPEVDPSIDLTDVFKVYEKAMHEPSHFAIELCLISVISNLFTTDPLWYFLVAPASSGKTEIINGFKYLFQPFDDLAYFTSKLTPHSLISGMRTKQGDPSLLKKFDNHPMALFIKDFTNIIAMREPEKAEIYAQLRDSYDGYSSKDFGNGVVRKYDNLNYSIIAGVTYEIYNEASSFQSLGERFGKLLMTPCQTLKNLHSMMDKAGDNLGNEGTTRDTIACVVYSFIKNLIKRIEDSSYKMPPIDPILNEAIRYIAIYSSFMRGSIPRDKYKRDYIKSKPTTESPVRFYKMLLATAAFRAILYGRDIVGMEELPLVRKIALDTVNQREEEILRRVFVLNNTKGAEPIRADIQAGSVYTAYTVRCVLEDFNMTGLIDMQRVGRKTHFLLSKRMNEVISKAHLYKSEEDLNRQSIADELFEEIPKRKMKIKKKR